MNTTKHENHSAVAGQVDCDVRPAAWLYTVPSVSSLPFASLVDPNGLTDPQTVSVPLYMGSDVDLLVEAERERCVTLCRDAAERLRNSGCKHEAEAVENVAEDLRA